MLMTDSMSGDSGGGHRKSATSKGFATTPRIWQEFLSDDFKFDVKALSSSSGSTDDAQTGTATGTRSGVHSGATTMISEDMSNVSLIGSTPPATSPRAKRATVPRMECDEPMLKAPDDDDEDEEKMDKRDNQQVDTNREHHDQADVEMKKHTGRRSDEREEGEAESEEEGKWSSSK